MTAKLPQPPAIIDGLPFDTYRAIDAASSHALSQLLDQSPLHLKTHAGKPSAFMELGTLGHLLILEPDQADAVLVRPKTALNSNAGKAAYLAWLCEALDCDPPAAEDPKAAAGKQLDGQIEILTERLQGTDRLVVTQDQYDTASRMRDAVLGHSIGRVLFDEGKAEQTLLAIDDETGLLCKGRLDWLPTGHDLLVDLKTCQSAAPSDVSRDAGRYRYHQQAAFYSHLWTLITGERLPFMFVFVESAPPFDVAIYELNSDALEAGERRFRAALAIWAECLASGEWPGLLWDREAGAHRIETLSIPRWAL